MAWCIDVSVTRNARCTLGALARHVVEMQAISFRRYVLTTRDDGPGTLVADGDYHDRSRSRCGLEIERGCAERVFTCALFGYRAF